MGDYTITLTRDETENYLKIEDALSFDCDRYECTPEEVAERFADSPIVRLCNAIMTSHGTPCPSKIGQAVWTNLGSFTKVCPQPRNDDRNGILFGNIEQPPKNDNQKTDVYHDVQ